jgi:thiol-disulfide isomerase/thioredoxin
MLQRINDVITDLFGKTNKKTVVMTICLVIGLVVLSFFIYRKYISPTLGVVSDYVENSEGNREGASDRGGEATVYYFFTEWCPHCKKGRPAWDAFKQQVGSNVGGYSVYYKEVDCDADTALASQFGVESYPTIKMVFEGKTYEYDARPDTATLTQFVKSTLGVE